MWKINKQGIIFDAIDLSHSSAKLEPNYDFLPSLLLESLAFLGGWTLNTKKKKKKPKEKTNWMSGRDPKKGREEGP